MANLRRRIFGTGANDDDSPSSTRAPSPAHPRKPSTSDSSSSTLGEQLVSVPFAKLERLNSYVAEAHERKARPKTGRMRRNLWIFGLGGLFGLLVAGFFASNAEVLDLSYLKEMNLDSIIDVLPAGLVRDAHELQKHERDAVSYDSFSVGLAVQAEGIEATHPVIMIPGVISTGLESWGTGVESRQYFRKRLWGSWSMMRALVLDKASWKKHIMLDKITGLDPPGYKIRASQGFDAADFFITGYWIWNKILENLATIGYDPSNAFTAAYDWRLTYGNLEVRDQYFSRLKTHIETATRLKGKKVVLLSHSMGSQVLYYFMHWVEAEGEGFGNGGPSWVEENIDSWINISGCMLGALKDVPAVLSGEMKDTAQMNAFAVYGLEKFLSRHERAEIFRAMFGISSMLPIGGDTIWGNSTWAPDDAPNQLISYGRFINFRETLNSTSGHAQNLTIGETLPYLLNSSEPWYADAIRTNYSQGIAHSEEEVEANQHIPPKWMNPLETRLPKAPSLKIFCFYGVGKPAERAYFYREDLDPLTLTNVTIDTAYSPPPSEVGGLSIDHGVIMGEGDGTVSLLSTGYMCNRGWRLKRYNPAGVRITTVEMAHEPDRFSPRGGPNTADHVDVLGRSSLNDLILRVAGGRGEEIQEEVVSRIREYSERVEIRGEEVDVRRGMGGGVRESGGEVVNVTASEDERREDEMHGNGNGNENAPRLVVDESNSADQPQLVEEVHVEVVHEEESQEGQIVHEET